MSLQFENLYTDIFTQPDNSIDSDGSIDPLGLLMIWTSLGNRVFHNRLNTVSTNIHFYTLNLFHHAIICELEETHIDKIVNLTGKAPYDNRNDLYDGIIIFLECLMAHFIVQQELDGEPPALAIPGTSKLKGIISNYPFDKIANSLPVDKRDGILVRQNLLGIHGRHKGPFEQMNLFNRYEYYSNKLLWTEIRQLFSTGVWNNLFTTLVSLVYQNVLNAKVVGSKHIRVKLDNVLTSNLKNQYKAVLLYENFKQGNFINFWEEQLGFSNGYTTASRMYKAIKESKGTIDYQLAWQTINRTSKDEEVQAICAIEPFLTSIQKIMNRLLQRGTTDLNSLLINLVRTHLQNPEIDIQKIKSFITDGYFNIEARKRLTELVKIFAASSSPINETAMIRRLIDYHQSIMKQRGNLPWLSISLNNSITQHRSFYYADEWSDKIGTYSWVNDYYLSTVVRLYQGLYLS